MISWMRMANSTQRRPGELESADCDLFTSATN